MSMTYDPNDPNAPRPGATGVNAPGGANAQQGFLGGLRNAAMGLPGMAQQALLGQQRPQIQPGGQPTGQQIGGQPVLSQPTMTPGGGPGSIAGALRGTNQGGLLTNLSAGLQNNQALAPAFKFGKQLASYF